MALIKGRHGTDWAYFAKQFRTPYRFLQETEQQMAIKHLVQLLQFYLQIL